MRPRVILDEVGRVDFLAVPLRTESDLSQRIEGRDEIAELASTFQRDARPAGGRLHDTTRLHQRRRARAADADHDRARAPRAARRRSRGAHGDVDRIFERFNRSGDGRWRSEGAGLGLAMVRAIAEAHHGQLTLASRPGAGATFTIVVPVDQPEESPA